MGLSEDHHIGPWLQNYDKSTFLPEIERGSITPTDNMKNQSTRLYGC